MKKYILLITTFILLTIASSYAGELVKSGEVLFYKPEKILLNTGELIDISKNARITVNTKPVEKFDYNVGAQNFVPPIAYVKINPATLQAAEIDIYDLAVKEKTRADGLAINEFKITNTKPLRKNEFLHIVLNGTPGKKAFFSVLGIANNLPMKETSPGRYRATFKITRGEDIPSATIIGILRAGVTQVQAVYSGISFAPTKPIITDFSPANNSSLTIDNPYIYACYKSPGALIDATRCALYLNGKETPASKSMNLIIYQPEKLLSGKNTVTVRIADFAGNVTYKSWKFLGSGLRDYVR